MLPRRALLAAALILVPARLLFGQCPDGSPPPCAVRVAVAPRQVDPNRIVVFPFRVAASDTLLGEGFAELLATEFSSDDGPRAIDMATVISAWRRAGGGLRTPLPRERALSLARELGAGLVGEGSIVGLGGRITVTTSLLSSTSGTSRGRPTVVRASADSIDHALRQTAAGLVAALGGQQRGLEGARYTESPDAMRLYLAGMNAWRRGRLVDSRALFERAMAIDTGFAQATFRRFLTNNWLLPPTTLSDAEVRDRAFRLRERLSQSERALLEAWLGTGYPHPRSAIERNAAHEQAAALQPDSPEALYYAGDNWFHRGAAVDPLIQIERSRHFFERAAAIDSQATVLRHLLEVAVRLRDTALLRRTLPAYVRTEDTGRWPMAFLGWSIIGDDMQVAALRRRVFVDTTAGSQAGAFTALVADVRTDRLDEMHRLWIAALEGNSYQNTILFHFGAVLAARGRPAAAESVWAKLTGPELGTADQARIILALSGSASGLDVHSAAGRASAAPNTLQRCELALWRLSQGVPLDPSATHASPCGAMLTLARLPLESSPATLRQLEALDSVVVNSLAAFRGYESLMLARAWETRGRPDRALRAIRYRSVGSFYREAPWHYPEEARLSLVVGDTASAVRALEYWLPIVRDAEPPHVARRDSLRALLSQLRRR